MSNPLNSTTSQPKTGRHGGPPTPNLNNSALRRPIGTRAPSNATGGGAGRGNRDTSPTRGTHDGRSAAGSGAPFQSSQAAMKALPQVHRIHVDNDNGGAEMREASMVLVDVASLRAKYKSIDRGQVESDERLEVGGVQLQVRNDGVIFFEGQTTEVVPWETFYDDITALYNANAHPACIATCNSRLQVLEERYQLHCLLNSDLEERVDRYRTSSGIFASATRVDNHVRLQAGMNAQQLVHFIRTTCEYRPHDIVRHPGAGEQTLQQLLDSHDITLANDASQLTVEGLGLHPSGEKRFIRFDVFDPEVNKGGKAAATVLQAFLTRDGSPSGRLFADVARPLLFPHAAASEQYGQQPSNSYGGNLSHIPLAAHSPAAGSSIHLRDRDAEMPAFHLSGHGMASQGALSTTMGPTPGMSTGGVSGSGGIGAQPLRPFQATEYTLPIYGNGAEDEWSQLARWVQLQKLANPRRNMWIIEIPRVASARKSYGFEVHQQQLERLFLPLFLATRSPDDEKCTEIAWLLHNIGGFTIRSDEDARSGPFSRKRRPPGDVPWVENTCDLYFAYYFWANLTSLNAFRKRRGMNTFQFRANAGERQTQLDSLMYSYLLCDSISHGTLLDEHPVVQYLYGMNGIGICMSPLTNNATDIEYTKNPFHRFYIRSLKVTLCTDSPLHYHNYDDPLLEEYSTASKIFRLTPVDISELALNSVLISAFPDEIKKLWLGTADFDHVNVQNKTCVPDSRVDVRRQLWETETLLIAQRSYQIEEKRRMSVAVNVVVPAAADSHAGAAGDLSASSNVTGSLRPHGLARKELDDPIAAALRMTAKEAEEMAAVHGFAAGGRFRLLPGGTATEKLAVYVTVDINVDYPRIKFVGPTEREGHRSHAAKLLRRALETRKQFVLHVPSWKQEHRSIENAFDQVAFDEGAWEFQTCDGVVVLRGKQKVPRLPDHLPKFDGFVKYLAECKEIVDNVHVKKLSYRRLKVLEDKFRLHHAVSHSIEASGSEDKAGSSNRDFYQTCKVDTNVRMENGMTARQLLNFILTKAHQNADDIVCHREGQEPQTLRQLLHDMSIDPAHLTVDDLNVQVDNAAGLNRLAFTPEGRDQLLTLLLKTDNEMKGRYFAELTKLTFEQFKRDQFTFAENRLPIYGASENEWDLLSTWFDTHGMACFNNRWMIQIPRIYSYLHSKGRVKSFLQFIDNIFHPLWAVSLHPSKHPRLFHFLNHISGFDCVEDERISEMSLTEKLPPPQEWTTAKEPPYNYYLYYLWANLRTLNEFRMQRNFSTFSFRPSCGEAGSIDHLLGGMLLANGISYGINLRLDPAVQYLYYLTQVGIAVSPLSNNTKLLEYLDNPFPEFFRRGLNVSLSTDSPLQYHHTQEPLIEEYSIASKVWKLSPTDMCEVARNSVRQSGFSHEFKQSMLGPLYFLSSSAGNDEAKTHLSSVRVAYRWETYHTEMSLLEHMTGESFPRGMLTAEDETSLVNLINSGKGPVPAKGIIAASTDEAAMTRMRAQRDDFVKKLSEVQAKLHEQRDNHRLLSDRYHEAVGRETQLMELRKTRKAELEAQIATMQAAANVAAMQVQGQYGGGSGSGPGASSTGPVTRQQSFAADFARRMSTQSAVDLHRVNSTVTTHLGTFDGSTHNDDDTHSNDGASTSRTSGGRHGRDAPAIDFRTGTETPWATGPMFAPINSTTSGNDGGANNSPPTARMVPGGRRQAPTTAYNTATTSTLDDDVLQTTQRLLAKMSMPPTGTTGTQNVRNPATATVMATPQITRRLPGGGVGPSPAQQQLPMTPQPPPRR
jgi:AMP deaminase